MGNPQVKAAIANMDSKSRAQLSRLDVMVKAKSKQVVRAENEYGLPGVLPPLNWFDPAGFSTDIDKNKLLFYREAEIEHGRICMSASLGFLVAEKFHPVFGGAIDVPSVAAGKDPRLLPFWAAIFLISGGVESQSFDRASYGTDGELAAVPAEHPRIVERLAAAVGTSM